jgi:hypothetical protein
MRNMDKKTPLVLTSHKAHVAKIIGEHGLVAADFKWEDVPSKQRGTDYLASIIRHRKEDFYCTIDRASNGVWVTEGCPGEVDWTDTSNSSHLEHIFKFLEKWAANVAREFSAKDYLGIAMQSPNLLGLPDASGDNTPFNELERDQMLEALERIEQHLLSFELNSDAFRTEVQIGLEMLKEETHRSGRTAFRYLVFSTLLSIGLVFLGADETRQLIDFATKQVGAVSRLLVNAG